MTNFYETIGETVKQCREYCKEGNYDESLIYYNAAITQIEKFVI